MGVRSGAEQGGTHPPRRSAERPAPADDTAAAAAATVTGGGGRRVARVAASHRASRALGNSLRFQPRQVKQTAALDAHTHTRGLALTHTHLLQSRGGEDGGGRETHTPTHCYATWKLRH